LPVVITEWFKQAAIEERNAALEAVAPRFVAPVGGEGVIEEQL